MRAAKERKRKKQTLTRELRNGASLTFLWPKKTGRRAVRLTIEEDVTVIATKRA